jgi:ABC-type transport system involved in multi-copper enzyme maturation permease subunit
MHMLRPLFALFERSLREQSRTKFTFLFRTAIGLLILFIVAENHRQFVNTPALGLAVLTILSWVNFFAITVFGLGTFASAITEEKEEGTLGLMLMTRLNPLAILLGKSTARLFDGLMLLAVQVPFTMLCVTLGGVSQGQILRCYGILASFLFLLCNVALLWSVVCRRTGRAGSMTTMTGLIFYLVPLFLLPFMFMNRFSGSGSAKAWYELVIQWSISINPGFDLVKTLVPRGGFPFAANSIEPSLIGGLFFFALAWLLFAPCCGTGEEAATPRAAKRSGTGPRRRLGVPRPGARAVAWKEFHFTGGGYMRVVVRGLVYAAIIAGILWWDFRLNRLAPGVSQRIRWETVAGILRTFGLMAFSVELGLVAGRLFGLERKRKTLGGLYTLPLGTARLVWQKILGALPAFIPSAGICVAGLAIGVRMSPAAWRSPDVSTIMLFATEYLFFAVLVLYLSLRMRRAVLATAIGGMFVSNLFFRGLGRGFSIPDGALATAAIFGLLIIVVAALIPGRLERAAAEE